MSKHASITFITYAGKAVSLVTSVPVKLASGQAGGLGSNCIGTAVSYVKIVPVKLLVYVQLTPDKP